ncbi:hypothetical protein F5X97DRAFT_324156 [Nemania serpens]|nr:hypothetical protein F5X97DRAFT_324156 [Nemania serpens]
MYSPERILLIAALAGISLAQTFFYPACAATFSSLAAIVPTYAPALAPWLQAPLAGSGRVTIVTANPLADPEFYVEQTWASEITSFDRDHISVYDTFITDCISTGAAGATVASYINSVLTATGNICQATATPSGVGSAAGAGPISTTPAPTATGINYNPSNTAISVAIAGAFKTTGILVGAAAMGGLDP